MYLLVDIDYDTSGGKEVLGKQRCSFFASEDIARKSHSELCQRIKQSRFVKSFSFFGETPLTATLTSRTVTKGCEDSSYDMIHHLEDVVGMEFVYSDYKRQLMMGRLASSEFNFLKER